MHDERQWSQATKAIRAGLRVDPTTRALNTPIYETTTFAYEDRQIPLSLYATVVSVQGGARYEELFANLHNALKDCKPYQEEN